MNNSTENLENSTKKPKGKNKIYLQVRDSTNVCKDALESNPKNIKTLYIMGKCMIYKKNYAGVKDVMERMKQIDQKNVFCNVLEGHLYLKDGQIVEAYDEFLRAYLGLSELDVYLVYGLGLLYDVLENYELAREWFTLILASDIELFKYLEIMYRIGVCFKKEKKLSDALGVFKRLKKFLNAEQFHDDVDLQMAHVYELLNETELCMSILIKLKVSKQVVILVNRLESWINFKSNNYEAIKKQFKCRKEGVLDTEFSLASLQKELNYCDCSVTNETNDQYILYLLGRVLAAEGRNEEALELFLMCTRLDPMFYLAFNSAGVINYKLKRYDTAMKLFQQALYVKSYFNDGLNNFKVVDCKLRNFPCNLTISESDPDIFKTRYLDSQTIFYEHVVFVNVKDLSHIKELDPKKFDSVLNKYKKYKN